MLIFLSAKKKRDSQYPIELSFPVCCQHIKPLSISRVISTIHLFLPWFDINFQSSAFIAICQISADKTRRRISECKYEFLYHCGCLGSSPNKASRRRLQTWRDLMERLFFWQSLSRHKFCYPTTQIAFSTWHTKHMFKECTFLSDLLVHVWSPWRCFQMSCLVQASGKMNGVIVLTSEVNIFVMSSSDAW